MVNRKGDAASMFLNEVFERVESKVMGLEQQMQMVNAEQRRDKENMGRLEVNNLKHNDEFRNILSGVQNDLQYKLEIKMTDLVNRLLSEQDQRARQIEEVRYQLEMKDKLANEKGRHNLEELRDRQNQIDSNVRQELQRKEASIQQLSANFDA
jgi:predicted secreted hydrolase